ncbi:MAG: hypothetical protein M3463_03850 [Verrucomicrobiota bacterium]|nr:hypothetical protein [Verrucomicrobiota bacterium]
MNDVLSTGNPFERTRAIAEIADDLDVAEIRAAIAHLDKTPVREREAILLQLFARWGELEPEAALQFARTSNPNLVFKIVEAVMKSWADEDPNAAEAGVARLPDGRFKTAAWNGLIGALSESDPQRAFTVALRTKTYFNVHSLFKHWARKDPEKAADQARFLPSGFWRETATRVAVQTWAEADIERALAWAQSLPAGNGSATAIQRRDPTPLAAVVQTWMNENAGAAMRWLEQLPDDAAKADLLAALSGSIIENEPQRAVELAAMMPPGKSQDAALRGLISKWSRKDSAGALAWAQQQTDKEVRQAVLPALVMEIAWHDTQSALQLALTIDKAGRFAVQNVLSAWASKEPAAAAAWVDAQPEPVEYFAAVASTWARKDQKGAREWVDTISDAARKDQVLTRMADRFAWDRPQMATLWIAGISDEQKRTVVYKHVAARWLRSDPKGARTWIQTAPLPAEVKADLLKTNTQK